MSQRGVRALGAAVIVAGALFSGGVVAAQAVQAVAPPVDGTYLVQLSAEPVAGYRGAVAGLRATRPAQGSKIDSSSPDVQKYLSYLGQQRAAVLAAVPGVRKLYDYSTTFAGFAARLSGEQAVRLARTPGVSAVIKDERRTVDTVTTPGFLGLTGDTGVWAKQFGAAPRAGDGVIIADIDTGLWPENPSFAALPPSDTDKKVKKKFKGVCDAGIENPAFTCNSKVIGARYFVRALGVDNVIRREYLSPRDFKGHGSHTASTAAGNSGVPAAVEGRPLGNVSGIAPGARIAVYKACWVIAEPSNDSCSDADLVAAIDAAVNDGVDVLNFSISGSRTSTVDPVELAFLHAADAGVFVAASAGNDGTSVTTVAHNSPWVTTVAAGSHPGRTGSAQIVLGDGRTFTGVGIGGALPATSVVLASAVGKPGAPAEEVARCYPGRLDPAKVIGAVVVCDRGVNNRFDKSRVVREAGGVGMILTNVAAASLNADLHYLPTVHVDHLMGAQIKAYVNNTAGPMAALRAAVPALPSPAPKVASFSSRGPALAGAGDLLKPDLMAPGVDVLAASSPSGGYGRNWDLNSGTSMASPHIAGLAALVAAKHPRWSPMAIKSALMTTASVVDTEGKAIGTDTGSNAGPRDYGAGHVTPARAFNPGLIYDSALAEWRRYLCGTRERSGAECVAAGGAIDPSDLNMPSISIGALAGSQTVTRTVTSVASKTRSYRVSVDEPAGVDITVTPSEFTIAPGEKRTFTVTIARESAPFDVYAFGALTWGDGDHVVRSPVAVRPVAIGMPSQIDGFGATGEVSVPVGTGYAGTLAASVSGLVPSTERTAALSSPSGGAPFPSTSPAATPHTAKFTISAPAGTRLLRVATFGADHPAGTDVDLYVYRAGTVSSAGSSINGISSDEVVNIGSPSGSYDVYVEFRSGGSTAGDLGLLVHSWALGAASEGNTVADPAQQAVSSGSSATVTVRWSGLEPRRRWLGRLNLTDGGTVTATSVLRIAS